MDQFVPVPVSVYNKKNLSTQVVTKQELPNYQPEQNPTYRIVSLEKKFKKSCLPMQTL